MIAEVGPRAATFDSPAALASWVGVCPGREESAEHSKSDRTPKGNRAMRRLLNQAAHAAVKTKGSAFQSLYRRFPAASRSQQSDLGGGPSLVPLALEDPPPNGGPHRIWPATRLKDAPTPLIQARSTTSLLRLSGYSSTRADYVSSFRPCPTQN